MLGKTLNTINLYRKSRMLSPREVYESTRKNWCIYWNLPPEKFPDETYTYYDKNNKLIQGPPPKEFDDNIYE